jgi:hypothetical protein
MTKRARERLDRKDKFVMLPHWLLKSHAWRALPHPARSLYVEGLELRYTGCNNGDIELGEREAADIIGSTGRGHCTQKYAGQMLDALEAAGFIRPATKGRFYAKRQRTRWILTRHGHLGHKPTMDFMGHGQAAQFESQRFPGPLTEVPRTSRDRKIASTDVPGASVRPKSAPSIDVPRTSVLVYQGEASASASDGTAASANRLWRAPSYVEQQRSAAPESTRAKTAAPPKSAPLPKAPPGSPRQKAAWLRERLDGGAFTAAEAGQALAMRPQDIEAVAYPRDGRAGDHLIRRDWQKLAALAARRTH